MLFSKLVAIFIKFSNLSLVSLALEIKSFIDSSCPLTSELISFIAISLVS